MAEIKLLPQDSSLPTLLTINSPPRNIQARISKSNFTNWSTGRKSVTVSCACCPDPPWQQAGSACMRCTTRVQQDLCFSKLSYLLHVDSQSSHLTEGLLDITLSFLKDTLRKINSFTQKSKMLHREDFLLSVKSWSNNVVLHLASCGMNLQI